jgi:hypothetical protein
MKGPQTSKRTDKKHYRRNRGSTPPKGAVSGSTAQAEAAAGQSTAAAAAAAALDRRQRQQEAEIAAKTAAGSRAEIRETTCSVEEV